MENFVVFSIWATVLVGILSVLVIFPGREFFSIGARSKTSVVIILIGLPVLLYGIYLAGLRPEDAGNDTPRYVRTFENLEGPSTARAVGTQYYGNTELLIWPAQSLLRPFLSSRAWLVTNFVLVYILCYVYYSRAAKSISVSPAIFSFVFLTFFLVYSGNTMRQVLAIPIGALGFHLYRVGHRPRAIILIALAIGFHWSTIIFAAAPLFSSRIFKWRFSYIAIPAIALVFSALAPEIIGAIVRFVNISEFTDRFELYFREGRVSHVGAVWLTANFWICTICSFGFLGLCREGDFKGASLHAYTTLALTVMLLGITNADFSERYMPYVLLVIPLQLAAMLSKAKVPPAVKNVAFVSCFLVLSMLVLFSESAQQTLSYTI